MIRRPPRSTQGVSSAASDVYKRQYQRRVHGVDSEGNFIKSYKKHHLYETDKIWAEEGPYFEYIDVVFRHGIKKRIGLGICMDINPYEFKVPFEAFEYATFHCKNSVDILAFSTNWNGVAPLSTGQVKDVQDYWMSRLKPFQDEKKLCYFLAANRIGAERSSIFLGSSCAFRLGASPEILIGIGLYDEKAFLVQMEFQPQQICLLYTSPSPRDLSTSRMPSSA
eukprot:TRINITY_DN7799_c0_g1_i5.p2 TRINITY_DN7799_c0_g1~~TRINITY_DN7799_c0_g1_i5.p2  ORF type:complete len:223 (-),score=37.50 TRINITY_DN7799_c0_g1_i5:121-789(-)